MTSMDERPGAPRIDQRRPFAPDATVLICTYNRAASLGPTLDSLARTALARTLTWDVLVVDNNSSDDTRRVVESRAGDFPVPLRYLFEGRQGKSNALNTGLRATAARVIVFTDDDVRVPPGWLEAAVGPLLDRLDIDYTGGPVQPIWGAPPPDWLDPSGNMGGTIAVKNHGAEPFIFEDQRKTPLGVNMAARRELIERIGGFRPDLGRSGSSLLGQEQAEFFYRSREARARGLYVPSMVLEHEVSASRLTFAYYRRWWYWKGVSHSRLHRIHGRTELGLELAKTPHLAGVPRFVLRAAVRHIAGAIAAFVRGSPAETAESFVKVAYCVGYVREHRRTRAGAAVRANRPVGSTASV